MDGAAQLHQAAKQVDALEERHNEIVDVLAKVSSDTRAFGDEVTARTAALSADLESIREEIRLRLEKTKRAAVLLSLIAQQEELAPVKQRIDTQPYEQYVDIKWLRSRLDDKPSSP